MTDVLESPTPSAQSAMAAHSDRTLLYCFLAVRGVHLAQGLICLASAGRSYRSSRRAAAVLVGAAVESAWLARRGLHRGALDTTTATVDACASAAGLMALASGLAPEDRAGSMNWMLPYSVGGSMAIGVSMPPRVGLTATAALAGTYAATVRESVESGGAPAAAALANAASYLGFYAVSRVMESFLRHNGAQLDAARREAIERGERLATERERNRQYRLVHDSALQVLEAIGRGWLEPDAMVTRARDATVELRRALRGEDAAEQLTGIRAEFESLAGSFVAQGLGVELVTGVVDAEPDHSLVIALRDAAREALTNVRKHAQTDRVVVHVNAERGGVEVTIRDHGCGFDPDATSDGFGLPESVMTRMAEAGGRAEIWSEPGNGTRVRLRGPT